ncbi:PIG-L deacetylase family protein [Cerasicoccus fimbriatus]|uniref:PIG-L deacetylase family protein n=1 Tax=Cerasicoccus fimbriatus TaxID=3014554 RepID=UPI0022B2CB6F|nr:PIG-L family deacetylase [Cerasicoccus sp. TK19100]
MMIPLSHEQAELFIPDEALGSEAISRTTHLGIGAHQDDLEFMALHGILQCFQRDDQWFGGVTCTDGAGSARTGPYADFTDEQMKQVRVQEQNTAAIIGQYSFIAQLAHPSSTCKQGALRQPVIDDLKRILETARPDCVYTHNPADKHATHIGVFLATVAAIRALPKEARPKQLIGCEVWRSLDWLNDEDKTILPLSKHPNLAASLNGVFDSQISGGKRYDLAVEGRRLANATFFDSHSVDQHNRVAFALDLTPLIEDDDLSPAEYVNRYLTKFTQSVQAQFESLA